MKHFFNYLLSLLLLSIILLPATSCRKDKETPDPGGGGAGEYYLKCKLNGQQLFIDHTIWQGDSFETRGINTHGEQVYLYGFGAGEANGKAISMGVVNKNRLTAPSSFEEKALVDFGSDGSAKLWYTPDGGLPVYSSIGMYDLIPSVYSQYPNVARDVVITVTEYNSTYIKGTFQGTVYPGNDDFEPVFNQKIVITDGEFKLKLPASAPSPDPENPVEEKGFIQATLDGETISISETTDKDISTGVNGNIYGTNKNQLKVSAITDSSNNNYRYIWFILTDDKPIKEGIYDVVYQERSYSPGWGDQYQLQLTVAGKNEKGQSISGQFPTGAKQPYPEAKVTITKFTNKKGEYIEGRFYVKDGMQSGKSNPVSLTEGKFRVRVK